MLKASTYPELSPWNFNHRLAWVHIFYAFTFDFLWDLKNFRKGMVDTYSSIWFSLVFIKKCDYGTLYKEDENMLNADTYPELYPWNSNHRLAWVRIFYAYTPDFLWDLRNFRKGMVDTYSSIWFSLAFIKKIDYVTLYNGGKDTGGNNIFSPGQNFVENTLDVQFENVFSEKFEVESHSKKVVGQASLEKIDGCPVNLRSLMVTRLVWKRFRHARRNLLARLVWKKLLAAQSCLKSSMVTRLVWKMLRYTRRRLLVRLVWKEKTNS
ncbi:hypothetical protein LWI28_004302 [Acer negundo]|uniref:Uncharacterized protein n=1 Tax=Acer negundo TaxID=4023 RepID=A0AAD5NII8_ACENE|nr:hypothetical protein LWI28_004302 [Acer negundo]